MFCIFISWVVNFVLSFISLRPFLLQCKIIFFVSFVLHFLFISTIADGCSLSLSVQGLMINHV